MPKVYTCLQEGGRDIPNVYVVFFKVFHRRAILADPQEVANNISLTIATNKQTKTSLKDVDLNYIFTNFTCLTK